MEAEDHLRTEAEQQAAGGEQLIADRLDAIETERVIRRALELEAATTAGAHTINAEQLQRIAQEIGVNTSFVRQALGEIRLAPRPRSRVDRWILPDEIFETRSVSGLSRSDVDAMTDKWMRQHEGLASSHVGPDGVEWDVDRRWWARARARTRAGSSRIARVAGGDLTHRVHSSGEADHIIAFESRGRWPLTMAKVVISIAVFVSFVGIVDASLDGDLVRGLVAFGVILAGAVTAAITAARWWARGIRGALRRSLTGLVDSARPKRGRWFRRSRDSPQG